MEQHNIPTESGESIKLTKNAKGEYQWEIKIKTQKIGIVHEEMGDTHLKRLNKINKELEDKYGTKS